MSKVKVLIVDDHDLVRKGFISLLQSQEELDFDFLEANDGEDAIRKLKVFDADLVLMDITMPVMDGLRATKEILQLRPDARIIALTMHSELSFVKKMMELGAMGYLLKNTELGELILAVKTVLSGKKYFASEIGVKLFEQRDGFNKGNPRSMTQREKDVLKELANGLTSKEIAVKLELSKRTIDTHRQNLINKLQVKNTAELVKYALSSGILDESSQIVDL